jgi:HD-GYP domain-containing protein (c-di-GMP phosphodiesterase class II)
MSTFVRLRKSNPAAEVHHLLTKMKLGRVELVKGLAKDLLGALDSVTGEFGRGGRYEGETISLESGHPEINRRIGPTVNLINYAPPRDCGLGREVMRETLHSYHKETAYHSDRVREAVVEIASYMSLPTNRDLQLAASFHDIGKIAVAKCLIDTGSTLLPGEWKVMELHQIIGYLFLSGIKELRSVAEIMKYTHVENGYPDGIANDHIPYEAHLVIIADTLDACLSNREYHHRRRTHMSQVQVFEELANHSKPRHPLEILTATAIAMGLDLKDASALLKNVFRSEEEIRHIKNAFEQQVEKR